MTKPTRRVLRRQKASDRAQTILITHTPRQTPITPETSLIARLTILENLVTPLSRTTLLILLDLTMAMTKRQRIRVAMVVWAGPRRCRFTLLRDYPAL